MRLLAFTHNGMILLRCASFATEQSCPVFWSGVCLRFQPHTSRTAEDTMDYTKASVSIAAAVLMGMLTGCSMEETASDVKGVWEIASLTADKPVSPALYDAWVKPLIGTKLYVYGDGIVKAVCVKQVSMIRRPCPPAFRVWFEPSIHVSIRPHAQPMGRGSSLSHPNGGSRRVTALLLIIDRLTPTCVQPATLGSGS
jgi:hypothetical protein